MNVCFYSLRSFIFSILNYAILHRLGSLLTYITLCVRTFSSVSQLERLSGHRKKRRRENGMKTEGEKHTGIRRKINFNDLFPPTFALIQALNSMFSIASSRRTMTSKCENFKFNTLRMGVCFFFPLKLLQIS